MQEHERLHQARIKAGYSSAARAAKALKIPYPTYAGHENGTRGMRISDMEFYAGAFGVDRAWLAFGEPVTASSSLGDLIGLIEDLRAANRISALEARALTAGLQAIPSPENARADENWLIPREFGRDALRSWVARVCEKADMTQSALAKAAGVRSSTINRIMNSAEHDANLSATTIDAVIKAIRGR